MAKASGRFDLGSTGVPALLMTSQNTVPATTESRAPARFESRAGPVWSRVEHCVGPSAPRVVNLIAVARLSERRGPHRGRERGRSDARLCAVPSQRTGPRDL